MKKYAGWRYINMTIDTRIEENSKKYEHFVTEIHPKISPYENKLNKKLNDSEFKLELTSSGYPIYLREVSNDIELFREENITLGAKDAQLGQEYGGVVGAQTIELNGETVTMQKAGLELKSQDRAHRKAVFEKILSRRSEDTEKLNNIMSQLIELRSEMGKNADFKNYRDYKFQSMGRFDYTVEDCMNFHESIKSEILPLIKRFHDERKEAMNMDSLSPFDMDVDPEGKDPLKPFASGQEMLDKTISLFNHIDPYFGQCLATMAEMKHLDLESKLGKSPGGYNYPLYEIGVPFIFMNSVGLQRDLITMVHEGGHAVHSFLSRDLELTPFKSTPSEIAELASMGMELISMEHWDLIYDNSDDLIRAKKDQLQTILKILPWVATVDKFQHWLYTNTEASEAERCEKWVEIQSEFSTGVVDWSEYKDAQSVAWHKQLHIFEVPFYYIEYGMAQLGAIALWRNYKQNPKRTIEDYKSALKLGYTESIPELYKAAGIKFDFSATYVSELAEFVKGELENL